MMTAASGISSVGLVVLASLVVAGILAAGPPDAFLGMIVVAMVLMVTAIRFMRQQENDRTAGE